MNLTLLKEFFAGFLRTRHFARHFRRLALLESFSDASVSRDVPPSLAHTLVAAANDEAADLLQRFGSHTDGLSEAEAQALRERHGLNEVEHEQPLPRRTDLWDCYNDPFNLLLTLLAVIS
ncbi:magnesium-translocating P-type ATPase, partial [Pseudomonas chlororaphis]|uniref:cation-transporting P-type ATPase n=1 Tax=Pseudomonas chlororaphis TaxID=587753 RepID=UPI00127DE238